MALSILVVDDEPHIRTMLRFSLEGNEVAEAASVAEAEALLASRDFDVAFIDLRLGEGDGLSLLARCPPPTAAVVMTAFGTIETAVQAMRRGAAEYLQKPFTAPQVQHLVERLVAERRARRELAHLRAQARPAHLVEETVRSPAMLKVLGLLSRLAATDATVLLRGETGTGKGVLARYLHDRGARAAGPFITVDLPSISANLLESELFGHARGAFTGASSSSIGRVELARGGTLFLDEVGELPLGLQPKLLRLAQEREYERVGDAVTRQGDVRLVAATHRDLKQMVAAGGFREDLYYRLKVVEVVVPPLRERREDVLPLAEEFLARARRKARSTVRGFSDAAERVLQRYDWPGNVRELQNAVERAAILGQGERADADLFAAEAEAAADMRTAADPEGETLAAAERRHIAAVIARYETMEEAARALGIDVVTLWRKRKKYGLG
jgi:NtrC-family two-component system response regulator AlgB